MKYIILIIFIFSSCSSNYHLKRAKKHLLLAESKGAQIAIDTIYKTVEVRIPEIRMDTLVKEVNFNDTITVIKDRIVTKVKVDTQFKTVYVNTVSKPDTVRVEVPIQVTKKIKTGLSIWDIIILCLVCVFIGYMVTKK